MIVLVGVENTKYYDTDITCVSNHQAVAAMRKHQPCIGTSVSQKQTVHEGNHIGDISC